MKQDRTSMRIHRALARAGIASRRHAEELVTAGRITVNGSVARTGQLVDPDADTILLDGQPIPQAQPARWIVLAKPTGYVTTRSDPEGRSTIFELVPDIPGLTYVGRLDYLTEGVILLTTDGAAAHRLTHPSSEVERSYVATVRGNAPEAARIAVHGVELDDGVVTALEAEAKAIGERRWELTLVIAEGRNREVRRLCDALGLAVDRLVRTRFGPVKLGSMEPGSSRPLTAAEARWISSVTGSRVPVEREERDAKSERGRGGARERGRRPDRSRGRKPAAEGGGWRARDARRGEGRRDERPREERGTARGAAPRRGARREEPRRDEKVAPRRERRAAERGEELPERTPLPPARGARKSFGRGPARSERGERGARGERGERGEREERGARRERPAREWGAGRDRGERSAGRDRAERDRGERERPPRGRGAESEGAPRRERPLRTQRTDRPERSERAGREDRPGRPDRSERARGEDRPGRPERPGGARRFAGGERPARGARPAEGSTRGGRPPRREGGDERPTRPARPARPARPGARPTGRGGAPGRAAPRGRPRRGE
jgi:23S rRNA pseudouridine2605 synthase